MLTVAYGCSIEARFTLASRSVDLLGLTGTELGNVQQLTRELKAVQHRMGLP